MDPSSSSQVGSFSCTFASGMDRSPLFPILKGIADVSAVAIVYFSGMFEKFQDVLVIPSIALIVIGSGRFNIVVSDTIKFRIVVSILSTVVTLIFAGFMEASHIISFVWTVIFSIATNIFFDYFTLEGQRQEIATFLTQEGMVLGCCLLIAYVMIFIKKIASLHPWSTLMFTTSIAIALFLIRRTIKTKAPEILKSTSANTQGIPPPATKTQDASTNTDPLATKTQDASTNTDPLATGASGSLAPCTDPATGASGSLASCTDPATGASKASASTSSSPSRNLSSEERTSPEVRPSSEERRKMLFNARMQITALLCSLQHSSSSCHAFSNQLTCKQAQEGRNILLEIEKLTREYQESMGDEGRGVLEQLQEFSDQEGISQMSSKAKIAEALAHALGLEKQQISQETQARLACVSRGIKRLIPKVHPDRKELSEGANEATTKLLNKMNAWVVDMRD